MKLRPIISKREARQFNKLPVIAVDLGFSARNRTTGVAWSLPSQSDRKKHCFGEAVNVVAEQCCSFSEVALVLEAPLSAAFDIYGNPRSRGKFEREPQSRWWSVGPGAATALSALFFLRQLHRKLKTANVTIHLVEGFVSGNDVWDHDEVAAALRDGFRGKRKCHWHSVSVTEGESVVSALDWLECESPHDPPVILQPRYGADVVKLLSETINQVRKGIIDPPVANAIGYLANVLIS
jgi:hypothetical protein